MENEDLKPIDEVYTRDEELLITIFRLLKTHYKLVVGLIIGVIIGVII